MGFVSHLKYSLKIGELFKYSEAIGMFLIFTSIIRSVF